MMTRKLLTVMAFGGVVALALVACSNDEEPDKLASSQSFCTEKAAAECKNLAASCGSTEGVCNEKRSVICNNAAAAAANQGRGYRPNAAQDCLDKIEAVFSAKVVTAAGDAEVTAVCDRVFGGSKKANEACTQTFECDGSLICDRGICIASETVSLKGQCNNAGQVCAAGSYCQAQGATKFCVEKNKLNDTCNADAPCTETLRCLNKCLAKLAVGEGPCTSDGDCAAEAPYCDTVQNKCRPKYQAGTAVCRDYGSTL